jgi:protein MAK11
MFFSTKTDDLSPPETLETDKKAPEATLPVAKYIGFVGGEGVSGRIKDFVAIPSKVNAGTLYFVAASSDGKVRLWTVRVDELREKAKTEEPVGVLGGTYETQNRVTCLAAFLMLERPEGLEDSEDEGGDDDEDEDDSGDDEDDE